MLVFDPLAVILERATLDLDAGYLHVDRIGTSDRQIVCRRMAAPAGGDPAAARRMDQGAVPRCDGPQQPADRIQRWRFGTASHADRPSPGDSPVSDAGVSSI